MVTRALYANSMPTRTFQYAASANPRALTGRTLQFAANDTVQASEENNQDNNNNRRTFLQWCRSREGVLTILGTFLGTFVAPTVGLMTLGQAAIFGNKTDKILHISHPANQPGREECLDMYDEAYKPLSGILALVDSPEQRNRLNTMIQGRGCPPMRELINVQ